MSYRWREADLRTGNVVDADAVNIDYNTKKSALNGGLDRDNLLHDSIGDPEYLYDSSTTRTSTPFYRADITRTNIDLGADYATYATTAPTASQCFACTRFQEYGGGWITAHTKTLSCREGMLLVEVRGWHFLNQQNAYRFPKWITYQVLVNNVPIIETMGHFWTPIQALYLVGSVPVADGDVQVALRWKHALGGEEEVGSGGHEYVAKDLKTDPQMFFSGVAMSLINRVR